MNRVKNMIFRHLAGLVIALCLTNSVQAQSLEINPQHPEQYTVQRNDTLWDIAAKFLKSPWQWPLLWQGNSQIKNPNRIYPGDTLVFSTDGNTPSLSLSRSHSVRSTGTGREVKLHPRIRETVLDAEIKVIPTDAIAQFLDSSRVVTANQLSIAPYLIEFAEEHLITGAGSRVYVRAINNPQTLNYTFFRQGQPYIRPGTDQVLGYEAIYVASAVLEKEGDPATLMITKSAQELQIGDRLLPSFDAESTLNYFPSSPETQINGNIINVIGGVSQIGQHNVVVIDRGKADGLKVGNVLSIYQQGRVVQDTLEVEDSMTQVKLPNELAGHLLIFRPFEYVSYALVMDAVKNIHLLDAVQTP